MIRYGSVSTADFQALQFLVYGDGTSTTLKVNVNKPPFNVQFEQNPPGGFKVETGEPITATATAAIDLVTGDTILTVTFSAPLPVPPTPTTPTFGLVITMTYDGLP